MLDALRLIIHQQLKYHDIEIDILYDTRVGEVVMPT